MSNPDAGNSGNESDQDFDPTAEMLVNDFDDEGTLAEEEAMEEDVTSKDEINALEEEGNIPIEELLKRYYGNETTPEESSVSSSAVAAPAATSTSTPTSQPEESTSASGSKEKNTTNYLESDYSSSEDEYEDASVATWKRSIQVGENFQAKITELQPPNSKRENKFYEIGEKLLWKPTQFLSSRQIDEYLIEYAKVNLNDDDIFGDLNLLSLPEGVHIKDDEQALYILYKCQYNITEALQLHEQRTEPKAPIKEMMSPWSEEECRAFENGMRTYGKDFFQIKMNRISTRTVGETVEFYYFWKKTERHDIYMNKFDKDKKKYSLHPGITDYMDRFLDEQENMQQQQNAGNQQAMSSQVSSTHSRASGSIMNKSTESRHQQPQNTTATNSSSNTSSSVPSFLLGNSSVTITPSAPSPVKTINVRGDRAQTILINKESDKSHHHEKGMSIMASSNNRRTTQASDTVTTTILLGNNKKSVKEFGNWVSSTSSGGQHQGLTGKPGQAAQNSNSSSMKAQPAVTIYKVPSSNNSRFTR